MDWNEELHANKGKKYFNEEKQKWYCKNCFQKFVEVNQDLEYGQEFQNITSISNSNKNKKAVTMKFYKTKDPNPVFAFDDGMIKIGECRIDIGKEYESSKDRRIKTILKFGGTFFDVTAIHIKTGLIFKTTLTFD